MPQTLTSPELLARLKSTAAAAGLTITTEGPGSLCGEIEAIKSKWWLGGRKAVYRMACRLDEGRRTVALREAVTETSWGLPPPAITVETERVSGWNRSGTRSETSVGGGGTLDFARVRTALADAANEAGWQLEIEGGRLP